MADTISKTQATTSGFIPEVWAQVGLGYLNSELYLGRNVARDTDFATAQKGSKITIGKRGTLVANAKAENTAVTLQNPTASPVEVSLDQHFEVSFLVEDIVKAQSDSKIMEGYMEDGMGVLAEKVEKALAAKHASFANASGADVIAQLLDARAKLSTARAPSSNRFAYVTPAFLNAVITNKEFVKTADYGDKSIVQDGEFGKLFGFRIFESVNPATTGSSPVVTHNLAMHKNALVLATRSMPVMPDAEQARLGVDQTAVEANGVIIRVTHSYDTDYLGHKITLDTLYGVEYLRPTFGVDIEV